MAAVGRRPSPGAVRDLLLAGLMFSSGTIDAIAFLGLGRVFTSFQTGNLVFLGIRAGDAGGPDLLLVAGSLAAFAVGVVVATRMVGASKGSSPWPRQVSSTLALSLLAQTGFLALWIATSGRPGTGSAHALVALSALAMGLQSGAVLSLGVAGVFTTAATATVMLLMRDLATGGASSSAERARLAGVLGALCAGAATGGVLLVHARTYAPVPPLVATAGVIAVASGALGSRRAIS